MVIAFGGGDAEDPTDPTPEPEAVYVLSSAVTSASKSGANLKFTVTANMSDGTKIVKDHTEKVAGGQSGNGSFAYENYSVYAAWVNNNTVSVCEIASIRGE